MTLRYRSTIRSYLTRLVFKHTDKEDMFSKYNILSQYYLIKLRFTRYSDYFMTFVLSFPCYALTHLGCHLRQTGLENLYTPYLCIGHMQVNTLDHVYGRCILRWHNLTSSYTLSSAEATPVRLAGQSSEGVPRLPSPSTDP